MVRAMVIRVSNRAGGVQRREEAGDGRRATGDGEKITVTWRRCAGRLLNGSWPRVMTRVPTDRLCE
jgi:hypothetical protein